MQTKVEIAVKFQDLGSLRKDILDGIIVDRGILPSNRHYRKKDVALKHLQRDFINSAISQGQSEKKNFTLSVKNRYSHIMEDAKVEGLTLCYKVSGSFFKIHSFTYIEDIGLERSSYSHPTRLTITPPSGERKYLYSTDESTVCWRRSYHSSSGQDELGAILNEVLELKLTLDL